MSATNELLEGIPAPDDDWACDYLPGKRLPPVALPSTSEKRVDLSSLPGRTLVYCYPRTGRPGEDLPRGWEEVPGARGCTPQTRAFRDHHAKLRALGTRVFGLSAQDMEYQQEVIERLHLPFELLSDKSLAFAEALGVPTFEVEGMILIKRLTLVLFDGYVESVFYPVFPPGKNAEEVVEWLSQATL